MSTNLVRRRVSVAVLSTGLLAGVLVPLTASAATAACPTFVDAAKDSAPVNPGLSVLLQDGQLDILAVTHSTSNGVLSSTLLLTDLNDFGSDFSIGDWYETTYTVEKKVVTTRVVRDVNITDTTTTRLQVDGVTTAVVPEAVYDYKAKTVTLKVKTADLEKAVGAPLGGKPFSAMSARSLENYSQFGLTWDTATATEKDGYVFGTACKGAAAGSAPAPATTGGASASPKPSSAASPGASASPTAKPSGSPSPAGSASASASASPTGPPPAPQPTVPVPAAGCFGFEDPKGDARPGGATSPGNERDLDLLAVTGRTTPTAVAGHLQVDRLAGRPSFPAFTGHRFEYQFGVGGKVVVLRASAEGPGTGTVDGATAPDLKVTAAFDVVSSQVVLSVERESLATVLGREVPDGTVLEAQTGRSAALSPAATFGADTATSEDAGRARYTVGDNTCFAPKITASLPGSVQTGDAAIVSVSLTTSDGRVAAGQTVTAQVGSSRRVSVRTDEQGNATLVAPVTDAAGSRLLVVRSSGSAGRGELTSAMRVVSERALLRLTASGAGALRTVTATLTDDDDPRSALAGQRVVFTFGDRRVAATTDAAGRAVARVPVGALVEAAFAGRDGFLTSVKAQTTAR